MKKLLPVLALSVVFVLSFSLSTFAYYPGFGGDADPANNIYGKYAGSHLTDIILKTHETGSGSKIQIPLGDYRATGDSEIALGNEDDMLIFGLYAYSNAPGSIQQVDIIPPNDAYLEMPYLDEIRLVGSDFSCSATIAQITQIQDYLLSNASLPFYCSVQNGTSVIGSSTPAYMELDLTVYAHNTLGKVKLGSEHLRVDADRATSMYARVVTPMKTALSESFYQLAGRATEASWITAEITNVRAGITTLLEDGFQPELIRLGVYDNSEYNPPSAVRLGTDVVLNVVEVINPLESLFTTAQSFLELEILPNFAIGSLFAVLICVPTVVGILKLFAGG